MNYGSDVSLTGPRRSFDDVFGGGMRVTICNILQTEHLEIMWKGKVPK